MIENIRLSFMGIFSHKIRSFLTMLGIIIGIAAIIAIVSTISGTNEQIKNNLIGAGNNTVKVQLMNGDYPSDFNYESPPDNVRMITDDMKKEIKDIREVENCTFYNQRNSPESLYYGNKQLSSSIVYGVDNSYFDTVNYVISEGRGFSEAEYSNGQKLAIIDSTLAKGYFSGESPVGKIIDISGEPFTIIGVATEGTVFEPVINSVDDYYTYNQSSSGLVFIPKYDWGICYRYDEPENCVAKAVDTDSMTNVGKKTADILNEVVLSTGKENSDSNMSYKSESLLEQAKSLQELSSSTNSMLVWIASISLLVGGIGVMNIMLVSVTERTREIGLKKALGARKRRILGQFLTEASVLTSIGGVIGVVSGIGLSKIIANIADVPVAISTTSIVVSVVFSMLVGIVFGLIPSIKAARLNPIDALRYE